MCEIYPKKRDLSQEKYNFLKINESSIIICPLHWRGDEAAPSRQKSFVKYGFFFRDHLLFDEKKFLSVNNYCAIKEFPSCRNLQQIFLLREKLSVNITCLMNFVSFCSSSRNLAAAASRFSHFSNNNALRDNNYNVKI